MSKLDQATVNIPYLEFEEMRLKAENIKRDYNKLVNDVTMFTDNFRHGTDTAYDVVAKLINETRNIRTQ